MNVLLEDLNLSESEELSMDAHEIVQSISSPFVNRILPIPRKPNDLPGPSKVPYISDNSHDDEPSNKKLAISKNIVKKKRDFSRRNSKKIDANGKKNNIEKRNIVECSAYS